MISKTLSFQDSLPDCEIHDGTGDALADPPPIWDPWWRMLLLILCQEWLTKISCPVLEVFTNDYDFPQHDVVVVSVTVLTVFTDVVWVVYQNQGLITTWCVMSQGTRAAWCRLHDHYALFVENPVKWTATFFETVSSRLPYLTGFSTSHNAAWSCRGHHAAWFLWHHVIMYQLVPDFGKQLKRHRQTLSRYETLITTTSCCGNQ